MLPNLYRDGTQEAIRQIWPFAQAAYLDNPLPASFKERLFVYLSRFTSSPYSLIRHTGFLLGRGYVAGDKNIVPHTLPEAMALLRSPPPGPVEVQAAKNEFLGLKSSLEELPAMGSKAELAIFQLVGGIYLETAELEGARKALQQALGAYWSELTLGLMTFIRMENTWTALHLEIKPEADVADLLEEKNELGMLLAASEDFGRSSMHQDLYSELQLLRRDKQHKTELVKAKKELEEKDRQKDKFIATLGHELRNPVAAITAVSEMFQMVNPSDSRLRNAGNILYRQSQTLGKMLDDLLDVSTFSFGEVFITKIALKVDDVLRQVLHDFEPRFKESGLVLKLDLMAQDAYALADRTRLQQVFEHIFANALQFTDTPGHVLVESRVDRKQVVVTISDSGQGFDPAYAKTILEPFSQEPQDLGRKRGGLGLGLAIAKMIVDLHDGKLQASSTGPGKGATLRLTLPLSAKGGLADSQQEKTSSSRVRVLVIEDNRDFAQLFKDMLQIMGCDPEVAMTAQEGLEVARQSQPDMIFCDIGLPGEMDGFGFARALRADARTKDIPLVAVSGYTSAEDKQKALAAGFDRLCPKPVKFGDISESLKCMVHKNRLS